MVMEVRPTLRALQLLPPETFEGAGPLSTLARAKLATDSQEKRQILGELRLGELRQPLLDDARKQFTDGAPDVHRAASKAASTKTDREVIYEVRSRTGAAWRGAVFCDEAVGWLVYADRHDRFHATVAGYVAKGSWRPTALDLELARRDSQRLARRLRRKRLLVALLDGLRDAARAPGPVALRAPRDGGGCPVTVNMSVTHLDEPAQDVRDAHTTTGLMLATIKIPEGQYDDAQEVVRLLAFIEGDGAGREQAFAPGGDLVVQVMLTHARIAQLSVIAPRMTADPGEVTPAPRSELHYVDTAALAEGFVDGRAVLALCGAVFVPQLDDRADLPVCGPCEAAQPVAAALLERLRRG